MRGLAAAPPLLSQGREQLAVYAAKAAVAHNQQHIAGVYMGYYVCHNVIHPCAQVALCAGGNNVCTQLLLIKPVLRGNSLVIFNG